MLSGLLEAVISMRDVLSSAITISGELFVMICMIEEKQLSFAVNLDLATQVDLQIYEGFT